jgi:hypothetical protein
MIVIYCAIDQSNFYFANCATTLLSFITINKLFWGNPATTASFSQCPWISLPIISNPILVFFSPVSMSFVQAGVAVAFVQMCHLTTPTAKSRQWFGLATICTSFYSLSHDIRPQQLYIALLVSDFYGRSTLLRLCLP